MAKVATDLFAPLPSTAPPTLAHLLETTPLTAEPAEPVDLPSPPPLNSALFLGKDFDASEFLLARRHTALEELRSELRAYLATLRTSLVAVINSEYEAFIGLSLGLRQASVATFLATIRRPVLSIRSEVTAVKDVLEEMREEMETVLEERKAVREAKALLRRLLEVEDAVEKVEGLLKLGDRSATGRELDRIVDSPAKRLERIAGEYMQMLYLVEKAGDMPFVRSLAPRIARITSTLHLDLSQLLTAILTPPASSHAADPRQTREALTSLFRTYASLGLVSTAEDVVRRHVVRPFVLKTIHRDVLNSAQSPVIPSTPFSPATASSSGFGLAPALAIGERAIPSFYAVEPIGIAKEGDGGWVAGRAPGEGELDPLCELYNKLLAFVSRDCGMILDVTERTLAVAPATTLVIGGAADEKKKRAGYEILTNVVWDEIAARLMGELGHVIFAAGRPSIFQQNYLLTTAFISRLESLAPTLAHLTALRSHPTYTNFAKRFQLPIYFQLRFKEIVTNVERTLDGGSGGGEVFLLSESESIRKALVRCWSEDVYLQELAGRFWRLTLQLLSRYRTWVNSVVPKYVLPCNGSSANLAASATTATSSSRLAGSPAGARPSTPGPPDELTEEATLRQLTILIADSRLMEKKVLELFDERIRSRLPGEDDAQDGSAASVLRESLAAVTSVVPSLASQIITILTKRCAEHLKLVKFVASQVRASTRKGPHEPSYFIPNVLKELRAYLIGPGKVVEEELRIKWATAVVEDVAARYAAILASQKKTEDGLQRFQKRQQGMSFFRRNTTAPAEDATPDDSKVKLQMQLDIDALGKDAMTLGVDVAESQAFEALRSAIVDSAEEKK